MDSIQQQISILTGKIDQIYQMLDTPQDNRDDLSISHHPGTQIVDGAETSIRHPLNREDPQRVASGVVRRSRQDITKYRNNGYADLPSGANYRHDMAEWIIAQQDILIDSSGVEISHHQIKEQDLSPQVQIQRLTAQLTAAYNRIAALEEQLLAKRWK
jgi:hypothetical protein